MITPEEQIEIDKRMARIHAGMRYEQHRLNKRAKRLNNPEHRFLSEIRSFYRKDIADKRRNVSLSHKGKPHKQAWGMHIVS